MTRARVCEFNFTKIGGLCVFVFCLLFRARHLTFQYLQFSGMLTSSYGVLNAGDYCQYAIAFV